MNGNYLFVQAETRYRTERARRSVGRARRRRRHPYIVDPEETTWSTR